MRTTLLLAALALPALADVTLTKHADRIDVQIDGKPFTAFYFGPTTNKPYLHPLRTLAGDVVSLFRPHDHVWHKGIAWSLPVVGDENFWGGPTFVRGEGYVQLPNNGTQLHRSFTEPDAAPDAPARLIESLDWVTEAGETVFEEQRAIAATILDAESPGDRMDIDPFAVVRQPHMLEKFLGEGIHSRANCCERDQHN